MRLKTILQMAETCSRRIDRTAFLIVRSAIWDLEADGEVRKRAEQLGHEIVGRMGFSDVEDVCEWLQGIGCGEVQVDVQEDEEDELVADMGYDNVVVYDCISCCGAPETGKTLCALEGGLIQGMVAAVEGREYYAIEYACWGLGDGRCAFALVPKEDDGGCRRVHELVRERVHG
ncbi:V4R domain-containing protein [Methanopyrus sp. KOL6]|uniref:V4R domain-containing protein n=1 Tax=Methanopyrus sp. KOL6 TaxID=1937004 RepID=UPI000B4A6CED|nr:V4R domain-containing protein [Methanopyrus sp. KOL6]